MKDKVVVLTGGVGGAKLVLGLTRVLPPDRITAIVNTGDDFEHLGLQISPDIDTLLYTLSRKANEQQGWGREGESWGFMDALRSLGGEDWFLLGDGDLAIHVLRTKRKAQGDRLSAITRDFAAAWGIEATILPMTDDNVATFVATDEGDLPFQRYFVERRCTPVVRSVRFEGAHSAAPAPGVLDALLSEETSAIFIAPSNPYLSIDPILSVPAIRAALAEAQAPVVAISPIVGGKAVKGPTAKLMGEMGVAVSPAAIASHYEGVIDGLLVDERDQMDIALPIASTDTLMITLDDRARVARTALKLAQQLAA
ncbi:MAG TPA: 2-phospho-L-lactate transferase [Rhizorhapis sp.]|nr:2-phospho-L-lactate transferase [Rhizorhapis sp.]